MIGRTLNSALALALLGATPALAQGFSSGSDGSDGALTFQANQGVVVFDPQALGIDADGDGIYHFITITIPAGTTVRLGASKLGEGKPVVWLATGAVQIDGTIDLNGANGHARNQAPAPAEAGAGGYNGGPGGSGAEPDGHSGSGPGGGSGGNQTTPCGGGAGHALAGVTNTSCGPPGVVYGNRFLLPLTGGSGGGGSSTTPGGNTENGGGGGAGGGALLIASSDSISIGGSIAARGGAAGFNPAGWWGGGGSGGAIRLMASSISGTGSLDVRGGSSNNSPGSEGRVRIEAFTRTGLTNVSPAGAATYSRPGLVFPPANAPTVRVSKVGAVDVTSTPKGSFVNPDVTINASGPVSLTIVASNVPVGTTVKVTVSPEGGTAFTVVSQPLAGTLASSTATAGPVTIPHGFSRFHVLATFTPQ